MATFEKRETKNGTSIKAVVRVKGFPAKRKTFKRLTDAKIWAKQMEVSMHRDEFTNIAKGASSYCLRDLIEYYIETVLPNKSIKTQQTEKGFLNWWIGAIGDYSLAEVTPELISRQITVLKNEGTRRGKGDINKPKSRRTIKYYRDILDSAFKKAVQLSWVAKNPLDKVDYITKLNNERVRFLDDKERKKLLDACKLSNNSFLYLIVVFAISTGARKGEIMKLTWADIDFERGFAILRNTKNGETRAVPIASHLLNLLKETKTDKIKPTHLLFPRQDGKMPMDIRRAWETAIKLSEIENFRFHDLRHSAASYLAMNGATLSEIAAVLGHKTLQMVKRYAHISEQHTSKIVTQMNDKIFGNSED